MPDNWGYVLFVYLFSWGILLAYTFWLWKTYQRLSDQMAEQPVQTRSPQNE